MTTCWGHAEHECNLNTCSKCMDCETIVCAEQVSLCAVNGMTAVWLTSFPGSFVVAHATDGIQFHCASDCT